MQARRLLRSLLGTQHAGDKGLAGLIARGSGGFFAASIAASLATFLLHLGLARLLEVESYGIYVFSLTWMRLAILPAKLGFESSSLRFAAEYRSQEMWNLLRGFLRRSHQFVGAAALLLLAAIGTGLWLARHELPPQLAATLLIACLFIPIKSLLDLQVAILRGLKRAVIGLTLRDVCQPSLLLITLLLIGVGGGRLSAPGAMALHILTVGIVLGLTTAVYRSAIPKATLQRSPLFRSRQWLAVSFPLFLIFGLSLILKQIDILMVGSILGTSEAGIYAASTRVAAFAAFGLNSVYAIASPLFAEQYYRQNMNQLQGLVTFTARISFLATIAICAGILLFGEFILDLFGEGFAAGAPALRILVIGQCFGALAGGGGPLLTMSGHQLKAAKVIGASTLINIAANALLIPIFGIQGAAAATAFSIAFWNLTLIYFCVTYLGINPFPK